MPPAPALPARIVPAADRMGALHWAWQALPERAQAEAQARGWLATLGIDAAGLARDAHGRPRLPAGVGIDVNWSHAGGGLLLACGAGVQLGVDVEPLRARGNALALARRFFLPAEADAIAASPHPDIAFLRHGCAKEALLKAQGRGLAFGLERVHVCDDGATTTLVACDARLGAARNWRLHAFAPQPGFHAVLAWQQTG